MVRGNGFYKAMKIVHIGHVPLPAVHPLGPRVLWD